MKILTRDKHSSLFCDEDKKVYLSFVPGCQRSRRTCCRRSSRNKNMAHINFYGTITLTFTSFSLILKSCWDFKRLDNDGTSQKDTQKAYSHFLYSEPLSKIWTIYLQINTEKYYVDWEIMITCENLKIVWSQFLTNLLIFFYIRSNSKNFWFNGVWIWLMTNRYSVPQE